MAKIYKTNTNKGPIYITATDKAKVRAYSDALEKYEKTLAHKYGKEFNILITPAEYKRAIKLHNRLNTLIQRVKRQQRTLKAEYGKQK